MVSEMLVASFAFMLLVATPLNSIFLAAVGRAFKNVQRGLILTLIGSGIVTSAVLVLVKSLMLYSSGVCHLITG